MARRSVGRRDQGRAAVLATAHTAGSSAEARKGESTGSEAARLAWMSNVHCPSGVQSMEQGLPLIEARMPSTSAVCSVEEREERVRHREARCEARQQGTHSLRSLPAPRARRSARSSPRSSSSAPLTGAVSLAFALRGGAVGARRVRSKAALAGAARDGVVALAVQSEVHLAVLVGGTGRRRAVRVGARVADL